jgi:phosphoserine phosphatase
MQKNNSVLIFDLDETILSVNSFPHWVRYMLWGTFGGLGTIARITLSLKTVWTLAERKLLCASHIKIKRRLQSLWQQALMKDNTLLALANFNSRLCESVRPQMKDVLQAVRDNRFDALLATAAVSEYADHLAYLLGFQHVLATPQASPAPMPENAREQKRDNVLAFLEAQQWNERRRIFFTDHLEDLPLIKESQLVLWFGKDSEVATVSHAAPQAKVINCRALSSAEIMTLIENA